MNAHPIRHALLGLIGLGLIAAACPPGDRRDPLTEPTPSSSKTKEGGVLPHRDRIPPVTTRRALFGDLHVHTSLSVDAFIFGVRALPDDAYHFAKGGTIEHGAGYPIRLSRPLDFLAVTDHAEYLGTARAAQPDVPTVRRSLPDVLRNGSREDYTRYWAESISALTGHAFNGGDTVFGDPEASRAAEADAWREIIAAAERHDAPGIFTAFIGYEWSSWGIHRNVVYGSDAVPERPFSSLDSNRAQDLWLALEAQREAGQPVIAIPHNMNESYGRMYPDSAAEGLEWTEAEATRRRSIEPVSEIYQVKGSSETHPRLSPDDPFADFEIVERRPMRGEKGGPEGAYARDALRTGLELAMKEGWNPYVFGLIASSDSHNASSPVEEDAHHGKLPVLDGTPGIRTAEALQVPADETPGAAWGGGGLAAVWAEENTRASIFAALERRETFATSGPRITVRFFGGWDFEAETLGAANAVEVGYRDGVPMGGFLPEDRPENGSPRFLVWADKDPSGANLDRLQILKGWVDAEGRSHERLYDAAASPGRGRDPKTNLFEPVGSSVDLADASYTNTLGATHLEALWTDPDFDPEQDAFYYVRVLEIPTPRMSTYDAKSLGITPRSPATLQERAATSAIWYDPQSRNRIRAGG